MVGKNFMPDMMKHISIDEIPKYYGGNSTMPFKNGTISFQKFEWESKVIAKVEGQECKNKRKEKREKKVQNLFEKLQKLESETMMFSTFASGFACGLLVAISVKFN